VVGCLNLVENQILSKTACLAIIQLNILVKDIDRFHIFYWGGARNFRGMSREQVIEATQIVIKPQ
jgi:hypothetical protein